MKPSESPARLFRVLMHPARMAILEVLRDGEQCVCHMEAALGLRQAYISQQLTALREAGLVADRRDGWNVYYRVTRPEIYTVIEAATQVVTGRRSVASVRHLHHGPHDCPCPKCRGRTV